ncbi:MAG: hypothetical protein ACRD2G_08335, partial [Terriglobia bacterium]
WMAAHWGKPLDTLVKLRPSNASGGSEFTAPAKTVYARFIIAGPDDPASSVQAVFLSAGP